MAEGVFLAHAASKGFGHCFSAGSAGTCNYQRGSSPDARAVRVAAGFGIDISSLRARSVDELDLGSYDWIFVMDHENYEEIGKRTGLGERPRLRLVMSFVPGRAHEEISDPYYGTEQDFMQVMTDLFLATAHIFENLAVEYSGREGPEHGADVCRGDVHA